MFLNMSSVMCQHLEGSSHGVATLVAAIDNKSDCGSISSAQRVMGMQKTRQAQAKHLIKAAPAKSPLHLPAYAAGHNAGRRTADQSAKPDDQRTDPLANGWIKLGPGGLRDVSHPPGDRQSRS